MTSHFSHTPSDRPWCFNCMLALHMHVALPVTRKPVTMAIACRCPQCHPSRLAECWKVSLGEWSLRRFLSGSTWKSHWDLHPLPRCAVHFHFSHCHSRYYCLILYLEMRFSLCTGAQGQVADRTEGQAADPTEGQAADPTEGQAAAPIANATHHTKMVAAGSSCEGRNWRLAAPCRADSMAGQLSGSFGYQVYKCKYAACSLWFLAIPSKMLPCSRQPCHFLHLFKALIREGQVAACLLHAFVDARRAAQGTQQACSNLCLP